MVSIDGYLKSNLDILKADVYDDNDCLIIVGGREGSGKSVFCQTIASYLDPTLTLDRICFTPKEFINAVVKAEKYQAVIFDEAVTGVMADSWSKHINKMLKQVMMQVRQKNLFIFLCVPSPFEIGKYYMLHRASAYFRTRKIAKGEFNFYAYNEKRLTKLYVEGKKEYEYVVSPNFYGDFHKYYAVDEVAYRAKKLKALEVYNQIEAQHDEESATLRQIWLHSILNYVIKIKKYETATSLVQNLLKNGLQPPSLETVSEIVRKKYLVHDPSGLRSDAVLGQETAPVSQDTPIQGSKTVQVNTVKEFENA